MATTQRQETDYDSAVEALGRFLTEKADAAGVATITDGDVEFHIYVDPDTRDPERMRHEVYKSFVAAIGKRMNPLAMALGGGPEWLSSFPPETIPRSEQAAMSEVDDTPEPAIEAAREADAHLVVATDEAHVEWDEPEGANYGDGLAARGDGEEVVPDLLEAVGRHVCR